MKRSIRKPNRMKASFPGWFWIILAVFLLTMPGCGGSDDGADGDVDSDDQPPLVSDNTEFEDVLKYTVRSVGQDAEKGNDMKFLEETALYVQPSSQNTRQTHVFPCGTMTVTQGAVTYVFSGGENCGQVTGTVTMNFDQVGDMNYQILYENFSAGDCTVNGSLTVDRLNATGEIIQSIYRYDDLMACCNGNCNTLNGDVTLTFDKATNTVTFTLPVGTYTYDLAGLEVQTDLTYTPAGGAQGTATVTTNGNTYIVSVNGVTYDPTCWLPTGGTLTITGPEGKTATADFTDTTCDNPVVVYTLAGETKSLGLEDVATGDAGFIATRRPVEPAPRIQ